jgi:hypothetical protein
LDCQKGPASTTSKDFSHLFERKGSDIYSAPSSSGVKLYTVNGSIGHCTCYRGMQGAYCKHQAAVSRLFEVDFPNAPYLTGNDKSDLYYIANGHRKPDNFFVRASDKKKMSSQLVTLIQIFGVR